MDVYQTQYGELKGLSMSTYHTNGTLKDCTLAEENKLITPYGVFIPQYAYDFRKKNHYALSLYEDGSLRRISLNHSTDIMTPIGIMSVELILFYENGNIKRLFPLNGQLSAYWDEMDEYQLAKEQSFDFPFGRITTKLISISFYDDRSVKALTIWPKEKIKLISPYGKITTRIGLSLYPNGNIKSLEPAYPTKINTPIGAILAYDKNANGISGENNSLHFTKEGQLCSMITSNSIITVIQKNLPPISISPWQELDIDGTELTFHTLKIEFDEDTITFNQTNSYNIHTNEFKIEPYIPIAISQCQNCDTCTTPCNTRSLAIYHNI